MKYLIIFYDHYEDEWVIYCLSRTKKEAKEEFEKSCDLYALTKLLKIEVVKSITFEGAPDPFM